MNEYLSAVNSGQLYAIVAVVLAVMTAVCAVFLVKSYRAGVKLGMDKKLLRRTITSSATFTLLPSISILLGVIALSGSLGVPLPWLRLSVIGALHYETSVADIAARAARIACRLADSNLVGYDQSERNTLYKSLKVYDFDIDKYILSKTRTECDCSSFVYAVYACLMPSIRYDGNAPATSEMIKIFSQWGFTDYTDSKFANDPEQLRPGDIVVKPGSHTAIVYDDATPTDGETLVTYSSDIDRALTALAIDVICGHWGNGDDRKNNIYRAVQKKVNELLRG